VAEVEGDLLGLACTGGDHLGPGCGDVDRDFRKIRRLQPFERAVLAVAVDLFAAQIALQLDQILLELGGGGGLHAKFRYRRISASDAEHRAALRLDLDADDSRGGQRRMAGDRIGDADQQLECGRGEAGGGQPDIGIAAEGDRVAHADPVIAVRSCLARQFRRLAGYVHACCPELYRHLIPLLVKLS